MADNWRLRAKCRELSLSESEALFFPKSGRTKNQAIRYCTGSDTCPVKEECLEFALVNNCKGIWAGTTYKDRKAIIDFRKELNGEVIKDPRARTKKAKRTGFKIT